MIFKLRLQDHAQKDMEAIKARHFSPEDKITAGYLVGVAVEHLPTLDDPRWDSAVEEITRRERRSTSKSTSLSLRQGIYDQLLLTQSNLQKKYHKPFSLPQVIHMVLALAAGQAPQKNPPAFRTLSVLEWNINGRSGTCGYVIPVTLIANELLTIKPHFFVLTEFVPSAGWSDLKSLLEQDYQLFLSPYRPHRNGVCIGIRRERDIQVLSAGDLLGQEEGDDLPDYYEVSLQIGSLNLSLAGTRIIIDCKKARDKAQAVRRQEQAQRFAQFRHLARRLSTLDHVIALGDFNNSRILGDAQELDPAAIDRIYRDKDSLEHNFQKMRHYLDQMSNGRLSLCTPEGDLSSVGAHWESKTGNGKPPAKDPDRRHKYDHLITNLVPERVEYHWDFLNYYGRDQFSSQHGGVSEGFPDHAILLAALSLPPKC